MYQPHPVLEKLVYDVLYNDENCYVIVCARNETFPSITGITVSDGLVHIPFQRHMCGHGHTVMYVSSPYDFRSTISIHIDGTTFECPVSQYPSYPDEFIMSTVVKREDNIMKNWIRYHSALGVSRFIIYDNDNTQDHNWYTPSINNESNLQVVLHEEIQAGKVIIIQWQYDIKFQQAQQNHSLFTFRKSKLIGLLDVDEYVNPQTYFSVHELEKNYCNDTGFVLGYRFFKNPNHLPETSYDFLKITTCDEAQHPSSSYHVTKLFIRPGTNTIVSVHAVTQGNTPYMIPNEIAYYNHYVFLNKPNYRGREPTQYHNDSILRIVKHFGIL